MTRASQSQAGIFSERDGAGGTSDDARIRPQSHSPVSLDTADAGHPRHPPASFIHSVEVGEDAALSFQRKNHFHRLATQDRKMVLRSICLPWKAVYQGKGAGTQTSYGR